MVERRYFGALLYCFASLYIRDLRRGKSPLFRIIRGDYTIVKPRLLLQKTHIILRKALIEYTRIGKQHQLIQLLGKHHEGER